MKRIIKSFITINIIIIILLFLFPLKRIDIGQFKGMPPTKIGETTGSVRTVSLKHSLTQTFRPTSKTLSGVALFFSSPKKQTTKPFFLKIKSNDNILATIDFQTKDVKSGLNTFFFNPISVSSKKLSLELSASKDNQYHLLLWKTNEDVYGNGSLFVNDRQYNEDLVFKTYYDASPLDILSESNSNNTALIPLFFLLPLIELIILLAALCVEQIYLTLKNY